MPILHKFQLDNDTQIGVWHITENMDELKWQLQWGIQDIEVFNSYKTPIRAMHWLCSRVLIRQMLYTNDFINLLADANGKPFLENRKEKLSISHSADRVAVIISNKNVGIDIQEYTPKIERIAAKFVNKEEWKMIRLDLQKEQLHLVWGAKESMYKLYGKRKVDFRGHMNISPFEFNNDGGIISGSLHKKEYQKNFNIHYKILEDYLLVFCADE